MLAFDGKLALTHFIVKSPSEPKQQNKITTMKNNTTNQIKASLAAPINDCYGFFGTVLMNEKLTKFAATEAWATAFKVFRSRPNRPSDVAIRDFLRSAAGRHFADAITRYAGTLAERIQQASGEEWVTKAL